MPYKSEKIKLKETQDRRKKLTTEQREEIGELYSTGLYSLNDLARQYNVSKKTILLIVNKDSAERAKEYRKEHWKEWQRGTKERTEAIKNTRKYKQELYLKGELTEDKNE
jgi:transposase-like protein